MLLVMVQGIFLHEMLLAALGEPIEGLYKAYNVRLLQAPPWQLPSCNGPSAHGRPGMRRGLQCIGQECRNLIKKPLVANRSLLEDPIIFKKI